MIDDARIAYDWLAQVPAWLGRDLTPGDGLADRDIDAAVAKLAEQGFTVPERLHGLHRRLGACDALMNGFNRFLTPGEWRVHDGQMQFLDENQGVCQWAVDADERVWMWVNDARHPEPLTLDDFLAVVLPYQLAQGGWPCTADIVLPAADLAREREQIADELDWPRIVHHNGLTIHSRGACMLWSLDPLPHDTDAHLFVSCLYQADLDDLCECFGFEDLG